MPTAPTIPVVWPSPEWSYFTPDTSTWVPLPEAEQAALDRDEQMQKPNTQRSIKIDGVICAVYASQKVLHHPIHGVLPLRRQDRGQDRGPLPLVAWASRNAATSIWEFFPTNVSIVLEEIYQQGDPEVNVAVVHQPWFVVSFTTMVQVTENAQCREVRRFQMKATWEFFDCRKPGWLKFSQKMTDILDDRYSKGVAELELVIQGRKMVVDFKGMRCQQSSGDFLAMRYNVSEAEGQAMEPVTPSLSPVDIYRYTQQLQGAKVRLAPRVQEFANLNDNPAVVPSTAAVKGNGSADNIVRIGRGDSGELTRGIVRPPPRGGRQSPDQTRQGSATRRDSGGVQQNVARQRSHGWCSNRRSPVEDVERGLVGDDSPPGIRISPVLKRPESVTGDTPPSSRHTPPRRTDSPPVPPDARFPRGRPASRGESTTSPTGRTGSPADEVRRVQPKDRAPSDDGSRASRERRRPTAADSARGRRAASVRGAPSPRSWSHPPDGLAHNRRQQTKTSAARSRGRQRSLGSASIPSSATSYTIGSNGLPIWNVRPRVDDDNLSHVPGGGNIRILSERLKFKRKAKPKVDDDNWNHEPGGGNVRIFSEKLDFRRKAKPRVDDDNLDHEAGGGQVRIVSEKLDFRRKARPRIDDDNLAHEPGGGDIRILTEKLDFRQRAKPKVDTRGPERPKGRRVFIIDEPVNFRETARPRVDDDNLRHIPGGGAVRIVDQKVDFRERAKPRVDAGW